MDHGCPNTYSSINIFNRKENCHIIKLIYKKKTGELSNVFFYINFLVLIPGIIFLIFGVGWVFAPQEIAPNFGMTVFEGLGLSSQIGDLGSYFISLSIMIIYGKNQ